MGLLRGVLGAEQSIDDKKADLQTPAAPPTAKLDVPKAAEEEAITKPDRVSEPVIQTVYIPKQPAAKKQPQVEPTDRGVSDAAASQRIPEPTSLDQRSEVFFQKIPWSGSANVVTKPEIEPAQSEPAEDTTKAHSGPMKIFVEPAWDVASEAGVPSQSAKHFFQSIPWDGEEEEIERISVSAAHQDNGYTESNAMHEPSNLLMAGLLSASHTSKRGSEEEGGLAVAELKTTSQASSFFESLPWL